MRFILATILATMLLAPAVLAMTDAEWADIEKTAGVGDYKGVEWSTVNQQVQADKGDSKYAGMNTEQIAEAKVMEGKEFLKKAEGLNVDSKLLEDKSAKLGKVMDFYKALIGEDEKFLEQFKKTGNFTEYTVVEGDWLSKLAEYEEVYGPGHQYYRRWPEIYEANKDLIKDPNLIYPGWVLKIPRP
jgi:nucleoid-associated protein YgaU